MHAYFRRLLDTQYRVVVEVGIDHCAILEVDLGVECKRQTHHDCTFLLRHGAITVQDLAAIHRTVNPVHRNFIIHDFNMHQHGHVARKAVVDGQPKAMVFRHFTAPATFLSDQFQYGLRAPDFLLQFRIGIVVVDVFEKLQRIDTRLVGKLIGKHVDGKSIKNGIHGTVPANTGMGLCQAGLNTLVGNAVGVVVYRFQVTFARPVRRGVKSRGDGGKRSPVQPGGNLAVGICTSLNMLGADRVVITGARIFLA